MAQLRFDFRDLFRSGRLGFSMQRMWIAFVGYGVGYLGYLIFTYLSLLANGKGLSQAWNESGLLPCLVGQGHASWYAWIIFAIGVAILLAAYLLTSTAIARASYMLLKGNNFYTWREAFAFALRKASSVLSTPVAIAVMAGCFVVGGLIIGLLARVIPYVGELGASLFTFTWMFSALLLFFLLVVLGVSLVIVPAIIATTDEDAFEAVFQSFSVVWSQPWRFVLYEALIGVVALVGMGLFAFAVKQGFLLMCAIFSVPWSFGDKFVNLASHGQYLLQKWLFVSQDWARLIYWKLSPYLYFVREFYPIKGLSVTLTISAYLFALSMLAVAWWVVSYGTAVLQVGNTIMYIILKKIKDQENLLERKDKEEEEPEEVKKEEAPAPAVEEKKEEPAAAPARRRPAARKPATKATTAKKTATRRPRRK